MGAVQPNPVHNLSALTTLTAVAATLLLLLQFVLLARHPSEILLSETLSVVADTTASATPGTGRVIVSPSFTLDHPAALEIDFNTTLSNQWLELPVSLVNEQTGQGFEFTKNIEFYSGVESGESWTEGSRNASAMLSAVPAGRYHLNFYPFSEAGPAAPTIVATVEANPGLWGNFWLVLGLLFIYPIVQVWRQSSYETRRWEESDFGPTSS
ncbi:hypothetical protein ACFQT0_19730 [Hymenobacter humi]|uniref:DUF4178 domain-containing protein n=1 Tax=Hymenobacter humi TaxID=1411620 RepID=A0ABW2U756_9BACT